MEEPMIAAITAGTASLKLTNPARMKRQVAREVPQQEDNLFVAIAA